MSASLLQCSNKVMETQLRKRMQQVKELFTDCTDVFEELIAVKTHLAEKIEECQSAVENIQGSLSRVDASQPEVEVQIQVKFQSFSSGSVNLSHHRAQHVPGPADVPQPETPAYSSPCRPPQDLCADLEAQEEQAEAVLKEVDLVSRVASPQVMEALSVDCSRLREAISHTKDLIHLKREERDKGLLKVIKGWSSGCLLTSGG